MLMQVLGLVFRLGLGGRLGIGPPVLAVDQPDRRGRRDPAPADRRRLRAGQPHRPEPATNAEFTARARPARCTGRRCWRCPGSRSRWRSASSAGPASSAGSGPCRRSCTESGYRFAHTDLRRRPCSRARPAADSASVGAFGALDPPAVGGPHQDQSRTAARAGRPVRSGGAVRTVDGHHLVGAASGRPASSSAPVPAGRATVDLPHHRARSRAARWPAAASARAILLVGRAQRAAGGVDAIPGRGRRCGEPGGPAARTGRSTTALPLLRVRRHVAGVGRPTQRSRPPSTVGSQRRRRRGGDRALPRLGGPGAQRPDPGPAGQHQRGDGQRGEGGPPRGRRPHPVARPVGGRLQRPRGGRSARRPPAPDGAGVRAPGGSVRSGDGAVAGAAGGVRRHRAPGSRTASGRQACRRSSAKAAADPRSCGSAARPRSTTSSSPAGASGASSARSGSCPSAATVRVSAGVAAFQGATPVSAWKAAAATPKTSEAGPGAPPRATVGST